jgi:hypothetical protein
VLVVADGLSPSALPGSQLAWSTSDTPALAHRHILTATYAGEQPNTLTQILSLYGRRTAIFASPGFLGADSWMRDTADHNEDTTGCLGAAIRQAAAWRRTSKGPHFVVLHDSGDPACPPVSEALGPLSGDQVWLIGAGSEGLGRVPVAFQSPQPLAEGAVATSLDLLPTLLIAASAAVPSDARGLDLLTPAERRAIFFLGGDNTLAIRTGRHLLTASATDGALVPTSLQDLGADSPLPLDDPAAVALGAALSAWHRGLSATTARERLGEDAFQRILQDGGYWEAGEGD